MKVCEKLFPLGHFKGQKSDGFYMHQELKRNIDILLKNIVNDWDFTILISGGGDVRVGKSVLGMQIASYIAYEMQEVYGKKTIFNLDDNFVFDGQELIKKGHDLGAKAPYSPILFDEAGADLDSKKVLRASTQIVFDYFRECGQYNLFNILIIPDFFDLPKGIAISRSICLLDVYYQVDREGYFKRGFFRFFSKPRKKDLYVNGKKFLNYYAARPEIIGDFREFYPIDEKKYREIKREKMLKRAESNDPLNATPRYTKTLKQRDIFIRKFYEMGYTQQQIGDLIETARTTISEVLNSPKSRR
ncbi:hypothetical protein CMI37_22995 [Candidatus Pacearchaeota archaeon]|nr:hypothetical protein [Candidatus Pacearchaeota archaeon]|tara:strand:- start:683 stop:1588 length:906 start_codon:yes stop_codon:yes gene_type:complete